MTAYALDVVSPQLPCGAAWLANALLELNVPIAQLWGFDTAQEWIREADGGRRYVATHLPWRQTLAALRLERVFRFRAIAPSRFSHEFPWQLAFAPRVVLMVRDPRDAVHSEWQRHRRNLQLPERIGLVEFARMPFMDGPIGTADLLWLHLACWLHAAERQPGRVMVLRFEDWKQAPVETLRNVCDWIGIDADDHALRTAASASDVARLQVIESALAAADPAARQFNRRGQAYEWRQRPELDWDALLGPQWKPLLERLEYPITCNAGPVPAFDVDQVLVWRGLPAADNAGWRAAIGEWMRRG